MRRKKKHILGLLNKLDEVLGESLDIFFEEHPYLEDEKKPYITIKSERRIVNEATTQKICTELDKALQE